MSESRDSDIMVTVCIFAYNHENYIEEAIQSVFLQECDFTFEILIGEDGSIDHTPKILEKLRKEFPERLNIIYQDQSKKIYIDGKPTGRYNFLSLLDRAKGKYIALLDGDDYWTYPLKLQKQVDLLEANPDCAGCFHNTVIMLEGKESQSLFLEVINLPLKLAQIDLLKNPEQLGHTSSFFFRNKPSKLIPENFKLAICDRILAYIVAKDGPWMVLNETMSCYRKNSGGIYGLKNIIVQNEFLKNLYLAIYLDPDSKIKYEEILKKRLAYYSRELARHHKVDKNYKNYFCELFEYIKFEKKNLRLLKILLKEEVLNGRQ